MQIGNPAVLNLLRSIKDETVLVDDNWNPQASVAQTIIRASHWLKTKS